MKNPIDILTRLSDSNSNESSHELQCRCFDAAEEISRMRCERETMQEAISAQAKRIDSLMVELNIARERSRGITRLEDAIKTTLDENGHLADGDNCTLIILKRALRYEEILCP